MSLTVSRYLCEVDDPARPGANFVQDIVVAKGKDIVVRVFYLLDPTAFPVSDLCERLH